MKFLVSSPGNRTRFVLGAAAITLLIFSAYFPALNGGFIWDDDCWVYQNLHVTGKKGIGEVWYAPVIPGQNYPLTYTFFWAQFQFWGSNPFGYHLSSILLHIIDILLLWLILRKIGVKAAWLVSAIFGLHPLMVESVAWITETKNTLSLFFLSLSFLFFLNFEKSEKKVIYSFSFCLYLLALLSKTFVCTFPLIMLLLGWYRRGKLGLRYIKQILPFFGLSALTAGFTWWYEVEHVGVQGGDWAFSIAERILIAGRAFWFYLGKLIIPVKLTFIYPRWKINPESIGQWAFPLLAAVILLLLWSLRNRLGRGPFTALACYTVFLLPALNFISFYAQIYSFVADHYAYLAVIGPLTLIVSGLFHLITSAGRRRVLSLVLLTALFFLTAAQVRIYRNLETLWRDTIAKNPGADMAHNNLGILLSKKGRHQEAISYFRDAIRLNPRSDFAQINLGTALVEQGKYEEAVSCFTEAVRLRADFAEAYYGLGSALEKMGRIEEAISFYYQALHFRPDHIPTRINLGIVLGTIGKVEEAIACYESALELDPASPQSHNNLGLALVASGRTKEGIEHYRKALRIQPASKEIHLNLLNAFLGRGKFDEAIRFYRRFLVTNPRNPLAHHNLAVALERKGGHREAIKHFTEAIRLSSDYAQAHLNLGTIFYRQGRVDEAIGQMRRALDIDPEYVKAHYNLGIAFSEQEDYEKAIQHLEAVLRLQPDFEPARKKLLSLRSNLD